MSMTVNTDSAVSTHIHQAPALRKTLFQYTTHLKAAEKKFMRF